MPGEGGGRGDPRRSVVIAALLWISLILLVLIPTGCPRFTPAYAVFLAATLGLAAAALSLLHVVRRSEKPGPYAAFKKLTGYGLVIHYVAFALPRVDWSNSGLAGEGRTILMFVLSLLCLAAGSALYLLAARPTAQAAFGLISVEEIADRRKRRERRAGKKKGLLAILFEWVDVIVSAVVYVILVQIFVFQLYVVPTESMVPVFLSGDRPFTVKFLAGPRIPLTEWRLPFLRRPARGDVVTIANPRYPENHRVDLKKYLAQFVSMLTLTGVNIDSKAPDGSPKSDPLVKRIVGIPGDKLMMVDDVLYARRSGDSGFAPVAGDRGWAETDLWNTPPGVRSRIKDIPIDEATRAILSTWDAKKRDADPAALAAAVSEEGARVEGRALASGTAVAAFQARERARLDPGVFERGEALAGDAVSPEVEGENALGGLGAGADDLAVVFALPGSAAVRTALDDYARTPAGLPPSANLYERSSRAVDLLIKLNLLSRVDRDLSLIAGGASLDAFAADAERVRLVEEARELYLYLDGFYDTRNFPEFPGGKDFLGPRQYFAMGDNRYNSWDFRFNTPARLRALDPSDQASVMYRSFLDPFPLERQFIEGYAVFRAWPPGRIGAIR